MKNIRIYDDIYELIKKEHKKTGVMRQLIVDKILRKHFKKKGKNNE